MESRSVSQIQFGHLPEQTVDVSGGVWRVSQWLRPRILSQVDDASLRRELTRIAYDWSQSGRDGGFVQDLFRNSQIRVLSVDKDRGIELKPFPRIWICKPCRRLHQAPDAACPCGASGRKAQLHFVGYCESCGDLREPFIPQCPQHGQARITFPGTASGSEILFSCPECARELRRGFGFPRCRCGQQFTFNVHRSSSVFTPRSVVIVNPASHETMRRMRDGGGGPRALRWLVNGMRERTLLEGRPDREALRRQLLSQGLPQGVVEGMLRAADDSGGFGNAEQPLNLPPQVLEKAEDQAVVVALATFESRLQISDLVARVDALSPQGVLYREHYAHSLEAAGLDRVEFLDKFPVLTGHFGYTRGNPLPGQSRLRAYRDTAGRYLVYGDIAETEALFVRLNPLRVADWLRQKGHAIEATNASQEAAAAILRASATDDVLSDLTTLIHSYAHRLIRMTAVHAGIERNALSELLVPLHLGFFVYAAGRGDFVLGGLQAVFEGQLELLLNEFVHAEHRCALDPGCSRGGGACVACLHLGEPSCRLHNTQLDRRTLTGLSGYLFRR